MRRELDGAQSTTLQALFSLRAGFRTRRLEIEAEIDRLSQAQEELIQKQSDADEACAEETRRLLGYLDSDGEEPIPLVVIERVVSAMHAKGSQDHVSGQPGALVVEWTDHPDPDPETETEDVESDDEESC